MSNKFTSVYLNIDYISIGKLVETLTILKLACTLLIIYNLIKDMFCRPVVFQNIKLKFVIELI